MTVEGVEYSLEVNNGTNHLHGGTKGFANRLWESRVETNRVVFSLLSPDGDQSYPHELVVEAIYDFDDEDSLEITFLAKSDGTTPVNLTNHVYWNLSGEGSGRTILDHELHLNASHVLEMNAAQIPYGTSARREGYSAGLYGVASAGRRHRCGVQSYQRFPRLRPLFRRGRLEVEHSRRGRRTARQGVGTLREDSVVAGGLHGLYGQLAFGRMPVTKSGGRYCDYAGVAIECQGYPDAVNHPDFPSVLLREGELYCQKIVFRLGTFGE